MSTSYSEFFYLVHAGQGRWKVNHRITDECAGVVARAASPGARVGPVDPPGAPDLFDLFDPEGRMLGSTDSIEHALGALYASA